MNRSPSTAISFALLAAGCFAWALVAGPLLENPPSRPPLNPLGINRSPYGEVFAMAMQNPIDQTFHAVWNAGGHAHAPGETCAACAPPAPLSGKWSPAKFLAAVSAAHDLRTNPKPPTKAHVFYLRRQVEDKLRFAYELDPAHYGNYASLHFFLTQPQLGTRPELTPSAQRLTAETIRYCLAREDDPRPALTAAAAAANTLEMMFNDRSFHPGQSPKYSIAQMRAYLALLDRCIARYYQKAAEWQQSGGWARLSPQRVAECQDRIAFIEKFRTAAVGTIARLETSGPP